MECPTAKAAFFLADAPGEAPELRSQVAVTLAGGGPCPFHECFAQPLVAATGGAGVAFTSGDVVARAHPCPRREVSGGGEDAHVGTDLGDDDLGGALADSGDGVEAI